ncbi:TPA: Hok/Gef family protein, partial [Escherichia coli]
MPQRTFLIMLIVVCVTILCFVWMVRDSLCGFRVEQGNTVLVATLAYEGNDSNLLIVFYVQ